MSKISERNQDNKGPAFMEEERCEHREIPEGGINFTLSLHAEIALRVVSNSQG